MSFAYSLSRIFSSPVLWFAAILLGLSLYVYFGKRELVDRFIGKMKKDDIKFCEECGAKNSQENTFCEKCGAKF